jgi:hypothetical protein
VSRPPGRSLRRLAAVLAFVVASQLTAAARADETEDNFVYVPAQGAESLTIDQKLGRLTVRGWDKPEVRIRAHKHARDGGTLDRLKVGVVMNDGRIFVRAGVRIGGEVRPLPLDGAGIDLEVDAPREVKLRASTWRGDLDASGFRAGAVLDSTGGEVRVHDVTGKVHSWTLQGRQRLVSIRGDVEAGGVTGDLELDEIGGDSLIAKVTEGQITARQISSPVVRLFSTAGAVVFVGALVPAGRYELTALSGDVRLQLVEAPFTVTARAAGRVRIGFPVRGRLLPQEVAGDYRGGGPALELTAAHGDVTVDKR